MTSLPVDTVRFKQKKENATRRRTINEFVLILTDNGDAEHLLLELVDKHIVVTYRMKSDYAKPVGILAPRTHQQTVARSKPSSSHGQKQRRNRDA
jgi:hypothetical protein